MKFAHKLQSNNSTILPSNFIFVDTETTGTKDGDLDLQSLKLGCACHTRIRESENIITDKWFNFKIAGDFWNWLDSRILAKQKFYMYAHNQHFDFFVLESLKHLYRLKWELKTWFVKSTVFIMIFKKGNKKLVVLDSGNILKAPLSIIGKNIGLNKLDIGFSDATEKELAIYCKRDVEILRAWLLKYRDFIKKHDLGNFRHTLASQSMQAFKHRFMDSTIWIHTNTKAYELERKGYYGGRTECFFIGEKKGEMFTLFDVNSMYPYVIKKHTYPVKLKRFIKRGSIEEIIYYLKSHAVVADVKIKINKPALPYRTKRLIFPIGTFFTVLTTPELKYILKHGEILEVRSMAVYEKKIFASSYVDFFYDLKKKYANSDDTAYYLLAKLHMNSLYGKFGQKSEDFKVIGECPGDINFIEDGIDYETGKKSIVVHLLGKVYQAQEPKESFDSFPAIAAHVTAYARLYLWRLIEKAGRENVFYCDTDSLLVNNKGKKALIKFMHRDKLGALAQELETDHIIIRGCKDYDFKIKARIKGIRKNAIQLSENVFEQDQFMKFRGMLRKNITTTAVIRRVTKTLTRRYDKGTVSNSGDVIPYQLGA